MKRLAVVTVLVGGSAGIVSGCSSQGGSGWNHPFKKYTTEEQLAANVSRGYTEIAREEVVYVVSTHAALKRVKEGGEPALKVAAIGFGPNGEKVIFEASKEGLEEALMDEYERRHAANRS